MDRNKLALIILLCSPAFAQVGGNLPSRPRRFTEFTVATLPAASTTTGQTFIATDAILGGSCATGGGSNRVWCRSNGSTYDAVNGGYVDLSSTQATIAGTKTFTGATNNTNTTTGISDCIRDGMYIAGSSCYATIAAAVSAAPSGGTVYSIPGHSETIASAIGITKPLVIILDGNTLTCTLNNAASGCFAITGTVTGIELWAYNNTTLTLSGANVVGISISGTATDVSIHGFNITGDGVIANAEYGVLSPDLVTTILNKVRISDNTITSTVVGVGIFCQTVATAKGVVIDHNHLTGIVGTASGAGYSIAVAGATAQPADTRVEFNYIELGQRHDIYISQGSGAIVMGNVSRLHRQAVTNGTFTPAIVVGRSQGVTVVGNFIDQSYDGGIEVFTDPAGTTSRNTVIADNVINNGQYWDIGIGTTTPSTDGFPTQVLVQGNSIYKTGINQFGIYLMSGKDISILDNMIQNNTTTSYGIRIEGSQETAGTTLYNDRVYIRGNNVITSGGSDVGVGFAATAASSGSNYEFTNNRINSSTTWFASGGAGIVDPNFKLFDTDVAFNANAFLTTKAYPALQSWPLSFQEQTAIGGVAGQDNCWADTTAHSLKCIYNNGTAGNLPLTSLAETWTLLQTFTAGIATGSSPPACTAGTAGFMCNGEGTAPTNVASTSAIYADSTKHEYMAATNGASTATPGMMVRVQPSPINNTAKTAAVTTATLCASAAGACNTAGQYRLTYNVWGSGTACATVTVGSVVLNFTWTDENAVTHTTINAPMWDQKTAAMTSGQVNFNTALGTEGGSGSFIISTNGTIIQYATTYTACTSGTGTYNLRIAAERLQ